MSRLAGVLVGVVLCLAVMPLDVSAAEVCFGSGGICVGQSFTDPGGPGGGGGGGSSGGSSGRGSRGTPARGTTSSSRQPLIVYVPARSPHLCPPEGGRQVLGAISRGHDANGRPTGGAVVATCPAPGRPAPRPITPPAAPSAVELWDRAPLPVATIRNSPPGRGLVGLPTWIWADGVHPVSVSVTLRGWTAAVTATPVEYRWATGDGGYYVTGSPGSGEQPAVRHTYQHHGNYAHILTIAWRGRYTLSGYGNRVEDRDLGIVTTSATSPYPVDQRQAVIVD